VINPHLLVSHNMFPLWSTTRMKESKPGRKGGEIFPCVRGIQQSYTLQVRKNNFAQVTRYRLTYSRTAFYFYTYMFCSHFRITSYFVDGYFILARFIQTWVKPEDLSASGINSRKKLVVQIPCPMLLMFTFKFSSSYTFFPAGVWRHR